MRTVAGVLMASALLWPVAASSQGAMSVGMSPASHAGPYKILKTAMVGGDGGFDYISADVAERRLYAPRNGLAGHLAVFNLETLKPVGDIAGLAAGGAVVDPKSHHGFSNTKPLTMWDSQTLKVIKTIGVDGRPDDIEFDPGTERVWVLSHQPPYATIIDAASGTVAGTLDLGGGPEQGANDGKGTLYVNISDKGTVAVVDLKTMTVKRQIDLSLSGAGGSGLALDAKNHILFVYYRMSNPHVVIVNADTGAILSQLPTGVGVDTVAFNPATHEAISAENGGTMTFIKERSPASFVVEQTLVTKPGAKTMGLDNKTGHIFTMTADYAPAPPDAPPGPAGRPARGPMVPGSFSIIEVGK
jgi:DNA-binding beta-propeller fold protein YncE